MRRYGVILLALLTISTVSTVCAALPAWAQGQMPREAAFTLSSPDFTDGGVIDPKFTCDGANMSPPLKWENPPDHVETFALTIDDPDAPSGNFTHWIVYNLPAKARELPANAGATPALGLGAEQGLNTEGKSAYKGMCPPDGEHHYVFRLYALSSTLALPTGITVDKKAFTAALEGHVLAQAELTGRYTRHAPQ